uniref:Serine/threonine-protein phosphatase 6 regulatory ankyrin repeat subunit C-like n=1 Tax=Crassostrea virginica TaxID=6565 RepID=A0A8B8BP24_CRAVI|nr:serine/threonine-protein phosphatase 6 regulatory ankyrin repeat subunit C-like [Crassostrea virginica]
MEPKGDRNLKTLRSLLDGPCTNLLQEVLQQHVPEKDIHKLLNDQVKKRLIIPFLRKLNQEDIFYPQTGVFNGTYADFDISLLYALIRNLTGIPDHNKGWGNIPDINDTSTAANIERIRILRNKCAHSFSSKLTDKEFKKEWRIILVCIREIEKTLPGNNKSFEDAAQNIFDAAKNQEDIGESLTKCKDDIAHTLKIQKEQTTRVEGLRSELKDTQVEVHAVKGLLDEHEKLLQTKTNVPQETEYEKSIFSQWQEDDAFFISTRAAELVNELIKTNNLVIVIGHSGSGKSAIIQHIALKFREQGWIVKPVYAFKDIYDAYKSENVETDRCIYVFNDPIGKESFDEISYNEWGRYREILNLLINNAKLLLTCRRSIIADPRAKGFFEQEQGNGDINKQKLVKVDINDSHCKLSTDEKKIMFKKHLPDAKPTIEDFNRICKIDMYFPLLCKLCRGEFMQKKHFVNVFEEPVQVLKTEIENYKVKDRETYCGLVCLILSKNDLCLNDLQKNTEMFTYTLRLCDLPTNTSPFSIINKLKPLCGLIVKKIGDRYSFYHDFVMEVTTYVFGSEHPKETIDFADVSFLRKRVNVQTSETNDPFTILLDNEHVNNLVKRLLKELSGNRFIDVILNPCLRNEHVISCFKQQIKEPYYKRNLGLITKTQLLNTEKEQFQNLLNESLYTRLEFVGSNSVCSPLSVLITFRHDELCKSFLKILKNKKGVLRRKMNSFFSSILKKSDINLQKTCLFAAVCANGNKDFLQMFTGNEIMDCKNIEWNNMYPIHIVSVFHNYHILDDVINKDTNVDIFTTDRNDMTPLMLASGNHTQEIEYEVEKMGSTGSIRRNKTVEALIQRGADINLCNKNGICPLYKASQNGFDTTANILLNNGAQVNLCDQYGFSPLFIACLNGYESVAKLLLNNGADVNLCSKKGFSSLHAACQKGYESITLLLLNNGADMNKCQYQGASPLHIACSYEHTSITECLLNNGADVNLCDEDGRSPLLISCKNGHDSTAKLLIDNGASANLCDKENCSPLYFACLNGYESIAKRILNSGANVNLCSNEGFSPLWNACQNGHESTAQLLLNSGADVNVCQYQGASPLHVACLNEHERLSQCLLNSGANVDLRDKNGRSSLYIACLRGFDNIVQLLLKSGANVNLCQQFGFSPLYIACQNGKTSIAQVLLNNGADVNLCDDDGRSPLLISCNNGHECTAKHLIDNGANANLCDNENYSPLHGACLKGYESIANLLLNNGANVNLCSHEGLSPLWNTCHNGHENTAQLLLKKGAEVNLCNNQGFSPLLAACQNGHENTAQLLLKNGADVNVCQYEGASPLHLACLNEHESLSQCLLNNGANVDLRDKNGRSPLYISCLRGFDNIVQLLLKSGANVNLCQQFGFSPLYIACQNGKTSTAQVLLNNGANLNLCDTDGRSPLLISCNNGHESTAKLLIDNGANVNLCDNENYSPLYGACLKGNENMAKLLLNNGANVNICSHEGFSPLWNACQNGHENTVKLLLNNGAEVNLCHNQGFSPLLAACQNGHENIARILLNNGADVNVCQYQGASPLHLACLNEHESLSECLLNNGANVDLCDKNGRSPLYFSCLRGFDNIVQLLLKSGANVNLCQKFGFSPLYIACQNGQTSTAQVLLNNGANVNLCDNEGISPFDIACKNGHENTAQLLLSHGANVRF